LRGDPKLSQVLVVYILREKSAWCGEITSVFDALNKTHDRLGSNCAATRGKSSASRAFRLLQSTVNSRVVLSSETDHMKLRVETNWGSEYGIKGLYLPVIDIPLISIDTPVFYRELFSAVVNSRSMENALNAKVKDIQEELEDLRRVYYDLLEPAPTLQRKLLSRTMADCLNDFKKMQRIRHI